MTKSNSQQKSSENSSNLQIPKYLKESEVLATIDRIVNKLAGGFTFGYYDVDDIKQESRIECLKALSSYDPSRPLDNFLYTHVKKRMLNLRRNKYQRNDPPCKDCHQQSKYGGPYHGSKAVACNAYLKWAERNLLRKNIMDFLDISNISDVGEEHASHVEDVGESIDSSELERKIDEALPVYLRADFLRLKAGEKISPKAKKEIEEIVRDQL